MKSRITIDLDFDNQPIIKVDYVESEDVRDKMVKRFLQSFNGISSWAQIEWQHNPSMVQGAANANATLRPVSGRNSELIELQKEVELRISPEPVRD